MYADIVLTLILLEVSFLVVCLFFRGCDSPKEYDEDQTFTMYHPDKDPEPEPEKENLYLGKDGKYSIKNYRENKLKKKAKEEDPLAYDKEIEEVKESS